MNFKFGLIKGKKVQKWEDLTAAGASKYNIYNCMLMATKKQKGSFSSNFRQAIVRNLIKEGWTIFNTIRIVG